ncbi:MAG: alpha/beta hydrolase [Actinomycetota bacterium]
MKQFPVFIPHGDEHVAAVITAPEGPPRGLVLLTCGIGAPRSHRFQLWTRLGERLAAEGLASARMDYIGIGDSTGERSDWSFVGPPVDEALAVAGFAMSAVGTDRFVVAGNCLGSRVALATAGVAPDCVGAVCIRAPLLERGWLSDFQNRAKKLRLVAAVRSSPLYRRSVRPLVRRILGRTVVPEARDAFVRATRHARLLFLYSEEDYTFRSAIDRQLEAMANRLPAGQRDRHELLVLPGGGLKGYESLAVQDRVLDALMGWIPGCFPSFSIDLEYRLRVGGSRVRDVPAQSENGGGP